jgi:hypothetical protein
MLKIILKYMNLTLFLLILVVVLYSSLSQGVSMYVFANLEKEIPRLVMSTFIAICIFFFLGVLIGKFRLEKNLINKLLYEDQPVFTEDFLVIPIQEEKVLDDSAELTKSDLDFLAGRSIRGFIVNLRSWPLKYDTKKNRIVRFPELYNLIPLAIVSWLLLVIKDYFVINGFFSSGLVPFVTDLILIGLVFSSGMALGEHIAKRKISCIHTQRGKLPTGIGEYIGIPYPLFGNIDSTFIFHSTLLETLNPKVKWKFTDYEPELGKLRTYAKEVVRRELERRGLQYDESIDLWVGKD